MADENYIKVTKESEGYSFSIGGKKHIVKAKNTDKSSLFNSDRNRAQDIKNDSNIFGNKYIAECSSTYVAPKHLPLDSFPEPISNPLEDSAKLHYIKIKNIESWMETITKDNKEDFSKVDVPYWTERIDKVSDEYNFPEVILTTIIGAESHYTKNSKSDLGRGPTGVTGVGVRGFFPLEDGKSWFNIYKQMNEPLLNEILYKKDANGNFIKDKNGNFVLKYKTPEALRDACAKDEVYGMKVGMLIFQMNYVSAIGQKKFKTLDWKTTLKAIEGIKNGTLKLTEAENKKIIETALKNYNSVFKTYGSKMVNFMTKNGIKLDQDFLFRSFPKDNE